MTAFQKASRPGFVFDVPHERMHVAPDGTTAGVTALIEREVAALVRLRYGRGAVS